MTWPHLLFVAVSLYLASTRADYTIDDSDSSILKFSENAAGPVWNPFGSDIGGALEIRLPNGTMQTVDSSQCYDGTYTYAACSTSDNCAVQFSFTGSGITIYVLQAGPQGTSASLSLDSGTTTTATLAAPSAPQYYIPHVTLFSVQNLPSGTHTAVMTVLDWNGGLSGMMLDYIDVNQAGAAGPTTGSILQQPSPTPTSISQQTTSQQTSFAGTHTNSVTSAAFAPVASSLSSGVTGFPSGSPSTGLAGASSPGSKKTNVAAIVGGVVGPLAFLSLGLFFCLCRRHRHLRTRYGRSSPFFVPQPDAMFMDLNVSRDPFASPTGLFASGSSGRSVPLQSWTDSDAQSAFTSNYMGIDPSPIANAHTALSSNGSTMLSWPVPFGIVAAETPRGQDAVALTRPAAALVSFPSESSAKSWPALDNTQHRDRAVDSDAASLNSNVRAPVVARVMDGVLMSPPTPCSTGFDDPEMRQHLDLSVSSWQRMMGGIGKITVPDTAPPVYDYMQAR